MPTDVLIYAIVAAGLVFWLRSILGTRHGDERERPNPYTAEQSGKILNNGELVEASALVPGEEDRIIQLSQHPTNKFSINGKQAESGLLDIYGADKSFGIEHFLEGAQDAFILIVEAFAKGDLDTLRSLLSETVYASFSNEIEARKARGETVSTEIHAIRRMEVTDAFLRDRTAYITIRFTADETCVIRDEEGMILSGNPERITEMVDVWVFAREVRSRDPRWLLVETRDDVREDYKTPLPDSGGIP